MSDKPFTTPSGADDCDPSAKSDDLGIVRTPLLHRRAPAGALVAAVTLGLTGCASWSGPNGSWTAPRGPMGVAPPGTSDLARTPGATQQAASDADAARRRPVTPGPLDDAAAWDDPVALSDGSGIPAPVRFADGSFETRDADLAPDRGDGLGRRDRLEDIAHIYGAIDDVGRPTRELMDGSAALAPITATEVGLCIHPDVSLDGRRLAFASTQHRSTADIYVKEVNGRTHRQITMDPHDDVMPALSPDGTEIAFASNRHGPWGIYVKPLDESSPAVRLTAQPDDALHPTFSPDGRYIAYCQRSSTSQRYEIWVLDRATEQQRFITYGMFPDWNPDPARPSIAFQRARERGSRLFGVWTIDLIDQEARNLTEIVSAANAACMHPTWSPDGRAIAFTTVPDTELRQPKPRHADVWVIEADGTNPTAITAGRFANMFPVWAPTGTIYFASNRSGAENIWAVDTARTLVQGRTGPAGAIGNADPETIRMGAP